jgi:hypothetical protein
MLLFIIQRPHATVYLASAYYYTTHVSTYYHIPQPPAAHKKKKSRAAPAPIYVQLKAAYTISVRPHTLVP